VPKDVELLLVERIELPNRKQVDQNHRTYLLKVRIDDGFTKRGQDI